ncbi:MAG: CerR family C-terminal domain-containing protein [Reyranella sp.]|uniref:TetR/AcrR family transcriptional regulator n=1 Tax=Reyranella sp. TaxID=1929291 RepID=UPI001AC860A2|nr:TetR/AcrR family transcriptional regulator [Reyranella sp.]MBN9085942.1 CerR family C-terminal domain-containing protein [Reyranella sp.]
MKTRRRGQAVNGKDRPSTRQELIEAAGQVFADKGYERATAKEICKRAGTNTAAVNYHFGGIEPLYDAALEEARKRIFSAQAIARAVEGKDDPRDRLEAALGVIVQALLGAAGPSWAVRLFGRDLISCSPTAEAIKEKFAVPRARLMRRLASQLMKLPEDDPALATACLSLMAPICTLILVDRRMLQRALPALDLAPENSRALAGQLVRYALAGLAASAHSRARAARK